MERRRRIPIGQNAPAGDTDDDTSAGMTGSEAAEETAGTGPAERQTAAGGTPAGDSGRPAPVLSEPSPVASAPEEDPLAALAAERDSYLESLLRLKAEFENFRKRSQRERDESESRARGRLLVEFLPILDNLGRALDAAEHHDEGKVLDGVRLTHSQFLSLLQREGVSELSPLGEPFDPEFHEAMLTQPSEYPEGIVSAVLERGYRVGDRVLRPARVAVSAGPPGSDDGAAGAARG